MSVISNRFECANIHAHCDDERVRIERISALNDVHDRGDLPADLASAMTSEAGPGLFLLGLLELSRRELSNHEHGADLVHGSKSDMLGWDRVLLLRRQSLQNFYQHAGAGREIRR